ncbi:hypothetical protein ACFWPU_36110 [Streptomyces sp. NPDC058471]|uniref:hypothetical protein n=1 Tax=Streptomyces sp. NPDC058471 TaxID=3346516 RepID=UPI00364FD157
MIELTVTELRHLLTCAERDLADFLTLTTVWSSRHLPDHCARVTDALARALDLPAPAIPPEP